MGDVVLPPDSQKRLIHLSRQTLESFVLARQSSHDAIDDPYLKTADYGAFVSLYRGNELRGCIGTCSPRRRLYETVIEMTEAAASKDHRVAPISGPELSDLRIDISVLSPLESVSDPLALEVGRHGLQIARGEKRGVLLPQVAAENRWSIESFLSHTCTKAGLPHDAWKRPGTEISSFTALIIEEEK